MEEELDINLQKIVHTAAKFGGINNVESFGVWDLVLSDLGLKANDEEKLKLIIKEIQSEDSKYILDRIVDRKEIRGKYFYKLRWKDLNENYDTWEPLEHIQYSNKLIEIFERDFENILGPFHDIKEMRETHKRLKKQKEEAEEERKRKAKEEAELIARARELEKEQQNEEIIPMNE